MKKNLFVVMAAMTLVIAMAAGASAAVSGNVDVSANVLLAPPVCTISGATSIAFVNVDEMTHAAGATATVVPPDIRCTNGAGVTVSDDLGLNASGAQRRLTDGANFIDYSISYQAALTGLGAGVNIGDGAAPAELGLAGSIPAGALTGKPAGNYTDTVVLTLTY